MAMVVAFLVAALVACGSSAPDTPVELEVAPPQSMPDLPFPPTDQLSLSERTPVSGGSAAYFPEPHAGQGRSYLRWLVRGEVFSGKQVLVESNVSAEPGMVSVVLYQEHGGGPRASLHINYGEDHGRWVAKSFRSGEAGELVELGIPEVHIPTDPARFHSERMRKTVDIEALGVERVTVPAGTFEAIRVRRTWANTGSKTTVEDTWWAGVGAVARVVTSEGATAVVTTADVLYEVGPADTDEARRALFEAGNEALRAGPAEPPG